MPRANAMTIRDGANRKASRFLESHKTKRLAATSVASRHRAARASTALADSRIGSPIAPRARRRSFVRREATTRSVEILRFRGAIEIQQLLVVAETSTTTG
jgi:hypothetical protein